MGAAHILTSLRSLSLESHNRSMLRLTIVIGIVLSLVVAQEPLHNEIDANLEELVEGGLNTTASASGCCCDHLDQCHWPRISYNKLASCCGRAAVCAMIPPACWGEEEQLTLDVAAAHDASAGWDCG